ncbi:actin-like ATPase domain-containing protein [Penicillium frequentans]|nr:actin-like ATPase domain-containing protein [Penicillium glabrum]
MGKSMKVVVGLDFGTTFRTTLKVPSVISYEKEISKWGYQVGPLCEVIRGAKLLLDESQDQEYAPSLASKSLLAKYGKNAVQASGEYLGYLVSHVKDVLQRRFGDPAKSMDLGFVLTVPAVWSDKAKDATLRAAIMAGINPQQISLVSEPEAAALHSLRTIQPNSITKGDVLVVCDAGGGTVDLISYKVQGLDPLSLEEATEGTDVDHFIPLPGALDQPDRNVDGGFVQLESVDIEEVFEPIVSRVDELVRAQLEKVARVQLNAKAIVLVGGFGSSRYLFQRLKNSNSSITVLQPPNAWAAVVSGAVLRGLEGNRVETRISRRWYGVSARSHFDESRHAKHDKYWSKIEEEWFVDDKMTWYINKSAKISERKPIKFNFYRTVKANQANDLRFIDNLFFCNDDTGPEFRCDRVLPLCTLETDLSKIPRKLFERKRNSKALLLFDLEFNGTSYGSVSSRY